MRLPALVLLVVGLCRAQLLFNPYENERDELAGLGSNAASSSGGPFSGSANPLSVLFSGSNDEGPEGAGLAGHNGLRPSGMVASVPAGAPGWGVVGPTGRLQGAPGGFPPPPGFGGFSSGAGGTGHLMGAGVGTGHGYGAAVEGGGGESVAGGLLRLFGLGAVSDLLSPGLARGSSPYDSTYANAYGGAPSTRGSVRDLIHRYMPSSRLKMLLLNLLDFGTKLARAFSNPFAAGF